MAQIDPSIAMGFRPIQIESPINQMAAISQLEGARQQRQMNMLQMQEYARKAKEDQDLAVQHNELAKIHGSGVEIGSPEYFNLVAAKAPRLLTNIMDQQTKREALTAQKEAREAETKKREFELGQQKEKLSKEKVNQAMADIAGFDDLVSINADIDKKLKSGELTEEQANQIRSGLPADDNGVPAWQRNSLMKLMDLKERLGEQQKQKERVEPKWEYKKVGSREVLVDVNPYSSTVGQMKPYTSALEDTEPKWELRKVGSKEVLVDTNPYSATVGQMKAGAEALVDTTPKPEKIEQDGKIFFIDTNPYSDTYGQQTGTAEGIVNTEPKWVARDIGGSIVYVDENRYSKTFGQQKSGASITKTAPPAAPEGRTTELRNYDAAKDGGFTGTFAEFLDQQKETADEREWRKAVKAGTFKGTFPQWKQTLRPVSTTNVAPPVQTVTVQGPNGPEMRDARTGRLITDDKGQALKPYDAGNKPLSPVQAQKLKKDQSVDNARITVAKDTADDIERNVDSLIGNEKKKIKPHKGLPGITGFNALLPSMPGSDARGAQQLLDNIKGKVTMMGKSIMSQEGKLGNMAVQEWKIVSDAVERLDPAAPNFADQLRNVVRQARRLENNLKAQHKTLYEAPAVNQSSSVRSEADAILDRK